MNKFQLENRLVDFAVLLIEIVNDLPDTKARNQKRKYKRHQKKMMS